MRINFLVLAATVSTFVGGSIVQASNITILNPGFALDTVDTTLGYKSGATDWLQGGGGVLSTAPAYFGSVLSQSSPADVEQQNAWSNGGTFSQVLTATLQPNTLYTLSANIGQRSDAGYPTPPGATLDLGYGASAGMNLLTTSSIIDPTPPSGGWSFWQTTFLTGAAPLGLGQALRIDLVAAGQQVQFDNISLTAVPEPSTFLLGGLGAIGLLVAARRRRR